MIVDLETTGIERSAKLVSAGILISNSPGEIGYEDQIFILFLRSSHASIRNLSLDSFRRALEPLADPRLTTVYHNATFDLGHLQREGIRVGGTIHDTMQMLRLLDQDRGGDGADVKTRRLDLRAPPGASRFTNYKLKDVVPMLVGLGMVDFPGSMADLPYREHVTYLASDLIGTKALYDHLIARLDHHVSDLDVDHISLDACIQMQAVDLRGTGSTQVSQVDLRGTVSSTHAESGAGRPAHQHDPHLRAYYDRLCAPLTPALVAMTEQGICADTNFIRSECDRLDALRATLEAHHVAAYGAAIASNADTARWLWGALRLRPLPGNRVRQGGRRVPSLKAAHLQELAALHRANATVASSLATIAAHRRALDLRAKLGGLAKGAGFDGRIHTSLVDRQATGRISASKPNLQAIARKQAIAGVAGVETFTPRNALVASPGFELVTVDLAQADIRVLAHAAAAHKLTQLEYLDALRRRRYTQLAADPEWRRLHDLIVSHKNPQYRAQGAAEPEPPGFDPALGSGLAAVFNAGKVDFYTATATAMLGPPPEDKQARKRWRDHCKQTILGIVNGMGPSGLAKRLGCDVERAKFYLNKFEQAYPNDAAYRRMIVEQIALTGRVVTFMGRDRTDTAHHWLVSSPRARILVTFKGPPANRYWCDVSPLEPRRHILTCYIHRAWDAMPGAYAGTLIYDAASGTGSTGDCTTRRDYHLYDTTFLQYTLPLRNFGWRSIRRVRPGRGSPGWGEEARYRGLDAVTRALFNAVAQGGTADLTKLMMLTIGPTLARFGAQVLLQVHDELIFEVPRGQVQLFTDAIVPELAGVVPGFAVPIVLEAKRGVRFGELEPIVVSQPGCE